jgi:lipopolysaccharide export system protein LptC
MLTRSAIFFPLALAALLALITFWVSQTVEQEGNKIDGSNRHDPDYIMNNFVTTQTDIAGKLRYVLAATEMMHYPDDDSTVLQRPRFTQYTTNKPYTQIEGLRGYVSSNGEEIELVDNVKVVRQAFENKGEMQVLTEKLVILPDQDLVKTNSPVIIKQAPKTVIHATGMIYDKKKQTVQLFKRVRAHYEKPLAKSAKPASASPIKATATKTKTKKPTVKTKSGNRQKVPTKKSRSKK